MKISTSQKIALELINASDKVWNNAKIRWSHDPAMMEMYQKNVETMRIGAGLILDKKPSKAYKLFQAMEPAAREEIPVRALVHCASKA